MQEESSSRKEDSRQGKSDRQGGVLGRALVVKLVHAVHTRASHRPGSCPAAGALISHPARHYHSS